jgi:hypothetical protein
LNHQLAHDAKKDLPAAEQSEQRHFADEPAD